MYLCGSVITTGVTGLGLMTDNETRIQERSVACRVLSEHMHTALRNTHNTRTHRGLMRLYQYSCRSDKWKPTACVSFILCLMASLSLGTAWLFIRVMFHTHYQVLFILWGREGMEREHELSICFSYSATCWKVERSWMIRSHSLTALSWNNVCEARLIERFTSLFTFFWEQVKDFCTLKYGPRVAIIS